MYEFTKMLFAKTSDRTLHSIACADYEQDISAYADALTLMKTSAELPSYRETVPWEVVQVYRWSALDEGVDENVKLGVSLCASLLLEASCVVDNWDYMDGLDVNIGFILFAIDYYSDEELVLLKQFLGYIYCNDLKFLTEYEIIYFRMGSVMINGILEKRAGDMCLNGDAIMTLHSGLDLDRNISLKKIDHMGIWAKVIEVYEKRVQSWE